MTGLCMIDIAERLHGEGQQTETEDIRFSYSRPEQRALNRAVIRLIERLSGQKKLERLYRTWSAAPRPHENIFTAGLRLLGITVETDEIAWARVPAEGPVLFIANHPFGVVDGLMMGHLTTRIRPDTKIMTHSLLCQPPEARDYLLPVDFGGTPEAQATSLLTRRRTIDWLKSGHAVAVFPAGSVSTAQSPFTGPALDCAWHPFVAKLARIPGVTIVPVYFHGQNSRLFQIMSHTHYALRIALLFRETARRARTVMKVSVGSPITSDDLNDAANRDDLLRELRRRTLSLGGSAAPNPDQAFTWPRHINWD
ncbi:lysophospholipid acyltransferase family protein [Aestuariivirga sp.]|uniref:lysophospholipid acyltransferase family protein n=1 Tax=Aestuariivirga sp. TaxID=2650926 RepID=UPI0039E5B29E